MSEAKTKAVQAEAKQVILAEGLLPAGDILSTPQKHLLSFYEYH